MSGLLIRELELRGLAERILIVCPSNLAFQWQRELKEKFDTKFLVMKGQDIREQFGVNQWLERNRVITSLDLAKRSEILPGERLEAMLEAITLASSQNLQPEATQALPHSATVRAKTRSS
jgi:SNF2 family DNA or RNA helicase